MLWIQIHDKNSSILINLSPQVPFSLLEFEKFCTNTDLLIHVFPLLVSHPVILEVHVFTQELL